MARAQMCAGKRQLISAKWPFAYQLMTVDADCVLDRSCLKSYYLKSYLLHNGVASHLVQQLSFFVQGSWKHPIAHTTSRLNKQPPWVWKVWWQKNTSREKSLWAIGPSTAGTSWATRACLRTNLSRCHLKYHLLGQQSSISPGTICSLGRIMIKKTVPSLLFFLIDHTLKKTQHSPSVYISGLFPLWKKFAGHKNISLREELSLQLLRQSSVHAAFSQDMFSNAAETTHHSQEESVSNRLCSYDQCHFAKYESVLIKQCSAHGESL